MKRIKAWNTNTNNANSKFEEIINVQAKTKEKQAAAMKRNAESIEKLVSLLELEKKTNR